jgi:hypothetical protein
MPRDFRAVNVTEFKKEASHAYMKHTFAASSSLICLKISPRRGRGNLFMSKLQD